MVDDAARLVVEVAMALKLAGRDPVITAENSVRLMQLADQMLTAFGIGTREAAEDGDG